MVIERALGRRSICLHRPEGQCSIIDGVFSWSSREVRTEGESLKTQEFAG